MVNIVNQAHEGWKFDTASKPEACLYVHLYPQNRTEGSFFRPRDDPLHALSDDIIYSYPPSSTRQTVIPSSSGYLGNAAWLGSFGAGC